MLKAIEFDCEKNNATIINIKVDDTLVNEDIFQQVFEKPIDSIQKLELQTISENDVITFLNTINISSNAIINDLLQVPVLLQSNKDLEVSNIVTSFVDHFNTICHTMSLCNLFPSRFSSFVIEDKSFSAFLEDFTPILNDLESSLTSKDTVLTGDLAEYEIVPRLQSFSKAIEGYIKK